MFSLVDTALQMSSSSVVRLDCAPAEAVPQILRLWFDDLPPTISLPFEACQVIQLICLHLMLRRVLLMV